jgi:hypothetical protein
MTRAEALKLDEQPTLFGLDKDEADVYKYATHFRRQLKARLLEHKIVTQIIRETTLAPNDFLKSNGQPKRRLEDPATVAWKLSTGAYYKAAGHGSYAVCAPASAMSASHTRNAMRRWTMGLPAVPLRCFSQAAKG